MYSKFQWHLPKINVGLKPTVEIKIISPYQEELLASSPNKPALHFLTMSVLFLAPFSYLKPCSSEVKFQIQASTALNKQGTSKKTITEYGFCISTLQNAVSNSVQTLQSIRTLREVTRIKLWEHWLFQYLFTFFYWDTYFTTCDMWRKNVNECPIHVYYVCVVKAP